MMNRIPLTYFLLTVLISMIARPLEGQRTVDTLIPENLDLGDPLGITPVLAGNFGELRRNHFHTGLDIKTNRKVGYKVYSIEDGFVSRINISPWGYGKAIYVDHSNGLTSVYAHLDHFPEKVDSVIRHISAQRKENFIDIQLNPGRLDVKKGEVIAYSGNSGSSGGPHLHFEVRDTESEIVLNPQLLGYKIADGKKPDVLGLLIYALSPEGYPIPGKRKEYPVKYYKGRFLVNGGNSITLPADFLPSNAKIGLAYRAHDEYDAASNKCGIYTSKLEVDQKLIHTQTMDLMDFSVNRYLNEHCDYTLFNKYRKGYHRNFRSISNPLPIYDKELNGMISLQPGQKKEVVYTTSDIVGNETRIEFTLSMADGKQALPHSWPAQIIMPDSMYVYSNTDFFVQAPRNTFYAPLVPKVNRKGEDALSAHHSFADFNVGVNKYFEIGLRLLDTEIDPGKICVMVKGPDGRERCLNGHMENGWAIARTRYTGTFSLLADTLSPQILPGNLKDNERLSASSERYVRVSDDLSGVDKVEAYLNEQWVNLYMDDGKVHFNFKGLDFSTQNVLTLIVTDSRGNESSKSWKFPG